MVCAVCFLQTRGYAQVRQDYEDFFTRRFYYRMHVRRSSDAHAVSSPSVHAPGVRLLCWLPPPHS